MPKITQHIEKASGKTLFSFEILPPLKGESVEQIFKAIDKLMEFKPPFVDVTYHREEFVYKKTPSGFLEKVAIKKRPGTVGISAAIMHRYQVDAVPHLICGGFSKEETENALIDLRFLGIDNVLALRGDPIKSEGIFTPEPNGNKNTLELIDQIADMNKGTYLHEDTENPASTDFCIGVSGYPEKHFEAANLDSDIAFLKEKIRRGGEYIVTQMFFDNEKFFNWVEKVRAAGITVPIIPGLKPLTTKSQLTTLPRIFHIDIPEEFASEVRKCENDQQARQIGIEWCIQQSKDLMAKGVPVLHYYTMSKGDAVYKIASALF